jgi:hypothetical protein
MSYQALYTKARENAYAQPKTHACVKCGKTTSIVRPVCEACQND